MTSKVAENMVPSRRDFMKIVWPVIGPYLGGGTISPVEDPKNPSVIDMDAGIDFSWKHPSGVSQGIASRVQYNRHYPTFSMRDSLPTGNRTETQKRESERHVLGALSPFLTVQAYISSRDDGYLIQAAAVRTTLLYEYLAEHGPDGDEENKDKSSTFVWVYWSGMRDSRIPVHVWRGGTMSKAPHYHHPEWWVKA